MKTQAEWVWNQLKVGKKITPKGAMDERGIMRLSAIIYDLRQAGVAIDMEIIEVPNRFGQVCRVAEYSIAKKATLFEV
tara:strand:- start:1092 stop:1325 length:234 start_codon:yes stop_codon:yes gene_type:complete